MIPDEQLHQLCGAPEEPRSTSRTLTVWKPVHEQLYALLGIQWPPIIAETMVGFTAREAEVVFVADHRWPAKEVGVWEFFDANRSMERVFRWQPQQEFDDRLANPWRSHVPTFVGHSSMACRRPRRRPRPLALSKLAPSTACIACGSSRTRPRLVAYGWARTLRLGVPSAHSSLAGPTQVPART